MLSSVTQSMIGSLLACRTGEVGVEQKPPVTHPPAVIELSKEAFS